MRHFIQTNAFLLNIYICLFDKKDWIKISLFMLKVLSKYTYELVQIENFLSSCSSTMYECVLNSHKIIFFDSSRRLCFFSLDNLWSFEFPDRKIEMKIKNHNQGSNFDSKKEYVMMQIGRKLDQIMQTRLSLKMNRADNMLKL